MTAAAIYARKSTAQATSDDAKSVTRQVERATAYAVAKGWTVDPGHVFVDDAASGADFERRPAFLRLMNTLQPRAPFQALVMSEESRLGREQIEVAYALKQLSQAGVRVWLYLEDRERTLETPTDKLLMSVAAFADELERERARQRTHDALDRKARAGHVAGGRVFGYDNRVVTVAGPDGSLRRSHVERVINDSEAAVVVRIFELAAAGRGLRTIAHELNGGRAPAPLPRRGGRSRSWAPSSIREVLHRALYRGVIEWGKTQKRDRWGRRREVLRPDAEWVRLPAPELRIVSDPLWDAAHERLSASRATYLARTAGAVHGRPVASRRSKYVLPGLAACSVCGGGLIVRSRASADDRRYVYGCHYHHARGTSVCANHLLAPMAVTDRAVIEALETEILDVRVVARTIEKAAALMAEPTRDREARHRALVDRLGVVTAEVARFTTAVGAGGGDLMPLLKALREREEERERVEAELSSLAGAADVAALDTRRMRRTLAASLNDWRGILERQADHAREALRVLLEGRIAFTPDASAGRYSFEGRVVVGRLISGAIEAGTFNSGGGPNGVRTRVSALRGPCPRPLDDGAEPTARGIWLGEEDSNPRYQGQNLVSYP